MRMKRAAVIAGIIAVTASAHGIEISAYLSGNFGADGSVSNSPGFQNHYVGTTFIGSTPIPERRNFFLFDVSGVSAPIVSAKLKLYVPIAPPDSGMGYISVDPTEDYLVTGTPFTPAEIATAGIPPGVAMAMFGTFGSGSAYALDTVSIDNLGEDLVMPLSTAALIDLNTARLTSGKWAATGRLTTLGTPPPPFADQLLFSFTDPTGAVAATTPFPRLEFETVPEPATLVAVGAGMACLLRLRNRRRIV